MSRVANNPIALPKGTEMQIANGQVTVKNGNKTMDLSLPEGVDIKVENDLASLVFERPKRAIAGTIRAVVSNMVTGVSEGFERKLELVGVGYRAQAQGSKLNLTLGFSHPVVYDIPEGVTAETPSQTEIIIKGMDKQKVGQVAADIRAYRPPEPYKGKGVRYADEQVRRKEAKKK